jgi:hypothetical protein
MDCRVEPGNDEGVEAPAIANSGGLCHNAALPPPG